MTLSNATLETDTTIFSVIVTTEATVSTRINMAATTPEQANDRALELVKSAGAIWELDEDSIRANESYLPDPESTEFFSAPQSNQQSTLSENTANKFTVGDVEFEAIRFTSPVPHWRPRIIETDVVLENGVFNGKSRPKLIESIEYFYDRICKGRDNAELRRNLKIPPASPKA